MSSDLPAFAPPADHDLAAELAAAAGRLLIELRAAAHEPDQDERPNESPADDAAAADAVRDAADAASHHLLLGALAAARPGDAVLSEEGERHDPGRLAARRVWIVDPLDGTKEFGERGRTDWAVHVALALDGVAAAGAVALPALGVVVATASPPPPPPPRPAAHPRILVSRSRPPGFAAALAARLGAELHRLGSAGAKAMAVVRGEADAYVHDGGMHEWDVCAPAVVAAAAGLHVSRLDGSPLRFNAADPYLPDLLICRPERSQAVLDALAGLR
ncbi:MAG: inositol monophosphatase family protein [Acidimicrobiales bacterium]